MKVVRIGAAQAVETALGGKPYYLLFNGAAMFEFQDEWETVSAFYENANPATKEGQETLAKGFVILARHGELAKRHYGYDKTEILTFDDVMIAARPSDLMNMWTDCADAIQLGYGREITDEDEEIDLGIAELQKKRVGA